MSRQSVGAKTRRSNGMYELKQKSIEYGNVGFALLAIRYIEEKQKRWNKRWWRRRQLLQRSNDNNNNNDAVEEECTYKIEQK